MVGLEPDLGSSKGTLSSGLEEAKMWTESVKTTPQMNRFRDVQQAIIMATV